MEYVIKIESNGWITLRANGYLVLSTDNMADVLAFIAASDED